ncbi:MAG: YidC/Oxa1 family membrane protein insertase [Clostridia bacterium]|nr:YidC/Oxa1 family membrane protein insertase [Clostridia bacterium]
MNVFDMLISTPLGYIISFIYSFVQNYGFTIILFTIVVKILLAPLMVKQQKSMVQMQKLQPELQKLQKKYANDKDRLNQETVKLYQDHKVNPAGGCLPLLIQLPIIIGLYNVIQSPVKYIMHIGAENIQKIIKLIGFTGKDQIGLATAMAENTELILEKLSISFNPINFEFFGLNLADKPEFSTFNLLWIIPALSALTAYISSYVSAKISGNTQQNEQMKSMNIVMPLMSAYFCFILPAGVGLYWIMSNVMQMILQCIITVIIKKKEENTNA